MTYGQQLDCLVLSAKGSAQATVPTILMRLMGHPDSSSEDLIFFLSDSVLIIEPFISSILLGAVMSM